MNIEEIMMKEPLCGLNDINRRVTQEIYAGDSLHEVRDRLIQEEVGSKAAIYDRVRRVNAKLSKLLILTKESEEIIPDQTAEELFVMRMKDRRLISRRAMQKSEDDERRLIKKPGSPKKSDKELTKLVKLKLKKTE